MDAWCKECFSGEINIDSKIKKLFLKKLSEKIIHLPTCLPYGENGICKIRGVFKIVFEDYGFCFSFLLFLFRQTSFFYNLKQNAS